MTFSSLTLAKDGYTTYLNDDNKDEDTTEIDTVADDSVTIETVLPWPQNIQERISKLLDNNLFETSTVGMIVYDLTDDSVLFSHNPRQLMRPASTLKMIVAVTALDRLGYNYEYKTQMYLTGQQDGCVLDGDIYCQGGFDPAFSQKDLDVFVDSLKSLGIDTIRGSLYADVSMKDSDRLGEGWCWDDDNPVLSPLLISRKDNFITRFSERLHHADVVVESQSREKATPHNAHLICTISRRLIDILPNMMKQSDNLYAESIFYQLAASSGSSYPATARQGRNIINRIVQKVGLKPSHYYIADGSGLSLYNYVSPELEIKFLKYAYLSEHIYPYLYETMPIAGVDGTLKDRMCNGYAYRNVHAKTGTLTGVSALAGYCTAANGHVLCFSIINMGIRHASSGRRFQDRVCEALCRP